MVNVLLVALGGALGSVARYGLNLALRDWGLLQSLTWRQANSVALPWGTLGANILGCLFIGVFSEWAGSKWGMNPQVRLLLTTGFCGGFTTLSTLLLEVSDFLQNREWALGLGYVVASLVLPFLALLGGMALVRLLARTF